MQIADILNVGYDYLKLIDKEIIGNSSLMARRKSDSHYTTHALFSLLTLNQVKFNNKQPTFIK